MNEIFLISFIKKDADKITNFQVRMVLKGRFT